MGHPETDAVAVRIRSRKVAEGSIGLFIDFPYASLHEFGNGADWEHPDKHQTAETVRQSQAEFQRTMDDTRYDVRMSWSEPVDFKKAKPHRYELTPATDSHEICFVIRFEQQKDDSPLPSFAQTCQASAEHWQRFWESGGAIDLSGSKDAGWSTTDGTGNTTTK